MSYDGIDSKPPSGSVIILNGGIGSEVIRRGVRWRQHGIEDASVVIQQIHMDYLKAGAEVS